jgi:cytoskeletal protein RodZ
VPGLPGRSSGWWVAPDMNGRIGADLRQARERAGLSVHELSTRTKIRESLLEAIERDDFSRLPGGLLARGHLRACASELGLDPESVVSRYRTEYPSEPPSLEVLLHNRVDERVSRKTFWWHPLPAAVLLVAATVVVSVVGLERTLRTMPSEPSAVATSGRGDSSEVVTAEAGFSAARSTPAGDRSAVVARPQDTLTVEITPTGAVWIDARADGKRVLFALVQAGERPAIEARREIVLRIGDDGTFQYSVNGVPGRRVGESGEVRQLRITRDNYFTFQGR